MLAFVVSTLSDSSLTNHAPSTCDEHAPVRGWSDDIVTGSIRAVRETLRDGQIVSARIVSGRFCALNVSQR